MGATVTSTHHLVGYSCFNPRARDGRDVFDLGGESIDAGFNPRARDGRDPEIPHDVFRGQVFQSTRP